MPAKPENLLARQEFILQRLQETGSVLVSELCATLGASIATIRRDFLRPWRAGRCSAEHAAEQCRSGLFFTSLLLTMSHFKIA